MDRREEQHSNADSGMPESFEEVSKVTVERD
jgi:hypothetical protein